jgi:hypothetical protein
MVEVAGLRPFLIEGLDCSGKKTVAAAVAGYLTAEGVPARTVIGPLVGGALGMLDASLANRTRSFRPGSAFARFRRAVYAAEPSIDGVLYRSPPGQVDVKVSSHFRAWARARVDGDLAMTERFERAAHRHVRFGGVALLTTAFDKRIERHRADFAAGLTLKEERVRFFDGDRSYFDEWDRELGELVRRYIPRVTVIDTTNEDSERSARLVVEAIRASGMLCKP